MGVTLEVFQSFGSFDCLRDLLKMEVIAGVMALAVARSASVDHSGYCKKKCLYVLFSGTVVLVLASVAVPRLTLVCVCAYSCVGVSISYVESLKFEGGAMVDVVPRQYSISGSVRVLVCNEALGTSSSLAVEGEAVQVGF